MRTASCLLCLCALAACRVERAPSGRPAGARTVVDSLDNVEQDSVRADEVRRALQTFYARLSARDWPVFAESFWPGATVMTTWVPPGAQTPRLDVATVEEFVRRAGEAPERLAVLSGDPVTTDVRTYGDLAQAWVVFRARAPRAGDSAAVRYGIDAFQLVRRDDAWRIVGLAFAPETPDRPLGAHRP